MAQLSCCRYNYPVVVTNGVSFVHVSNMSLRRCGGMFGETSSLLYKLSMTILTVSSTGTFVNRLSTSKDTIMPPDDSVALIMSINS